MTNMQFSESERRRRRVQFVMLALLFMAPVIAAWVAWQYVGEHGIASTTNAGNLVVPARPLETRGLVDVQRQQLGKEKLKGRWSYIVFAPNGCDDRCQRQIHDTRQIRTSVNKDMHRVQRILVLGETPSAERLVAMNEQHPDMMITIAEQQDGEGFAQQFSRAGFSSNGEMFFLVDPLGNLMMVYEKQVPASGVLKDLRKLLKVSQIG